MKDTGMSATRRRTDRIIRESFVSLLKEKPLEKISVQDLCERADLNRTTFYRYYEDIYALYDQVSRLFFDHLFTDVVAGHQEMSKGNQTKEKLQQDMRERISKAVDIIEEEKELCYLLLHSSNQKFAMELVEAIQKISLQEHMEDADESLQLRLNYMCGGIFSVILNWIRKDCQTDKQLIVDTINRGVKQAFHD